MFKSVLWLLSIFGLSAALLLGGLALGNAVGGGSGITPAGAMMGPAGSHGPYGPGGMMGSTGPAGPHDPGEMMPGAGGMMGRIWPTATPQTTPATGVTQVVMNQLAFQPASIRVPVGTTITWINQERAPHTVTFNTSGMQGSSLLQQGQSFSYTFKSRGTYTYYCAVHPSMTGTVEVAP
jgi:plastocyanin